MKLIRETTILSAPKGQNRPLATPADGSIAVGATEFWIIIELKGRLQIKRADLTKTPMAPMNGPLYWNQIYTPLSILYSLPQPLTFL